ncbi:ankyrin repeat domain-containing protein 50-like [Contarinia nasturtii]|uniref:ankyrin repeat domain-containing protein 50-like n=1 Tax=Contarinia nasturtii TaxID=265458 RepID=UPI0012D465EA|nr:ankyrin repeat domain-containing protein 50-like [Contarinia nasturtii]
MKSLILSILYFCAVLINATSDETKDLIQIKQLLRIGVNFDRLDSAYNLGLCAAATKGQSNVVEFLINNGANISSSSHGTFPLYLASFYGHDRVVDLLIKHGADVNVINNTGWTPINVAAREGHQQIVELLIEAAADFNFPNNDGETPLYSAVSAGHEDVVSMLLEKGADVNIEDNDGLSPMHKAVEGGFVEIVRSLQKNGAIANLKNRNNESAYDIAVKQGNQQIIDILVPPKNPGQKLHTAARNGDVAKIKGLLESGMDVNIVDGGERTPLFVAAANGQIDAVKVLLENGADINKKNKYGRAPIFDATLNDFYNVVEILIESGADINIKKDDGWTPLNMAAKKGYLQIVELLLRKGAVVNIQTFTGETPLYSAALEGKREVVETLIRHGANVNIVEDYGWTPLHRAVENGFEEIVEILVNNKANVYSKNKYNVTPWSIAQSKKNSKIIGLLKKTPRISEMVCETYGKLPTPHILGDEKMEDGDFPWMAALGYLVRNRLVYRCSGTIISDQFVLTSAHCTRMGVLRKVRLGKTSLADSKHYTVTPVMRDIQNITIHSGYDRLTMSNDIALIRVVDKIPFNNFVWPACLHTNLDEVPSNVPLTVTGWDFQNPRRSSTSSQMYKVNLTSMPLQECNSKVVTRGRAQYRNGLFEGQYCAFGGGSRGSCRVYSGGPLQYLKTNTSTIVGIVPISDRCGLNIPNIYTRVAYYVDWIESIVWSDLKNSK